MNGPSAAEITRITRAVEGLAREQHKNNKLLQEQNDLLRAQATHLKALNRLLALLVGEKSAQSGEAASGPREEGADAGSGEADRSSGVAGGPDSASGAAGEPVPSTDQEGVPWDQSQPSRV